MKIELESARSTIKQQQSALRQAEADHKHDMARLQLEFETKLQVSVPVHVLRLTSQGMLPAAVQIELEDTIKALKAQVDGRSHMCPPTTPQSRSLEQRVHMLQDSSPSWK